MNIVASPQTDILSTCVFNNIVALTLNFEFPPVFRRLSLQHYKAFIISKIRFQAKSLKNF